MKLRFKGNHGWRDVANGIQSIQGAVPVIRQDLKENYPHFQSFYIRSWMTGDKLQFDVGDYTCFYYLELEEGETWGLKMEL